MTMVLPGCSAIQRTVDMAKPLAAQDKAAAQHTLSTIIPKRIMPFITCCSIGPVGP